MRRLLLGVLAALAFAVVPAASASAAEPRIVGGEDADIANWPFLAAIVLAERSDAFQGQFCGGSLIAPRVVLTAAHCIDGRQLDVVLGRTFLSAGGGERIRVTEQLVAPGYDADINSPDLALLVLERASTLPPVPLAAARPAPGTQLGVAGWGLVEQQPRELSTDILQQAAVRALPDRACNGYGRLFDDRQMVCAGNPDAGGLPDSCNGDSGGPLVEFGAGGPVLVGAVSFGSKVCGDRDLPAVYANIAGNREWIDRILGRVAAGESVAQPEPPPANLDAIRLRFGRMACPTSNCFVDIRTAGPVQSLTGGLVLWVHRSRGGGRVAIDRFALARRVRSGRWRAWVNLPFGRLRLIAVGVDEDANPVTDIARTHIRVTPG